MNGQTRTAVETRGQFVSQGRSPGNENRRWHGTRRECRLGDRGQTQLCSSLTCSLCCIVRTSYDLNLFGKKTGWGRYDVSINLNHIWLSILCGRFGRGIYTSSTSSKWVILKCLSWFINLKKSDPMITRRMTASRISKQFFWTKL